MVRSRFDSQLEQLNVELIKMGALCEEAITASVSALIRYDKSVVQTVFEKDNEIDRMERDIETFCMRLLLQQQPVARDLRAISSALKMISDMERIGDQAGDIAEIMANLCDFDTQSRLHIQDMARAAVKMVTDAVDAFVDTEAEEIEAAEDDVLMSDSNDIDRIADITEEDVESADYEEEVYDEDEDGSIIKYEFPVVEDDDDYEDFDDEENEEDD